MPSKTTDLKVIKAFSFLSIPLILWLSAGELLPSISAYAYVTPILLGVLLTMAGMVFFDDGYIDRERYYNMIIGGSLIVVALTPYKDFPITHFFFAGVFFLGSLFVMIAYSSIKQRMIKIFIGLFIVVGLLGHFLFSWYSLFFAEWIAMLPISLHYAGESYGKLD